MRGIRHRYELPVEPRDERLDVTLTLVGLVILIAVLLSVTSLLLEPVVKMLTSILVTAQ